LLTHFNIRFLVMLCKRFALRCSS